MLNDKENTEKEKKSNEGQKYLAKERERQQKNYKKVKVFLRKNLEKEERLSNYEYKGIFALRKNS